MKFWSTKNKYVYLDHAAASPLKPAVLAAMRPYLTSFFGNPSSVHKFGIKAASAVEDSRATIASLLKVRPEHVYFTASGSESNNLILFGVISPLLKQNTEVPISVVSVRGEHPSVNNVLEVVSGMGVDVKYSRINEEGLLDLSDLESLLSPELKLVTVAYANSETGVVQNLREISRLIKSYNKKNNTNILLHTDASQAPLWLSCELEKLGVDFMTLDAGKCCGPKGVGVIINRSPVELGAHLFGGSQERSLRPGTENVAGIVGAAKALELAIKDRGKRVSKVKLLRDYLIDELQKIDGLYLNGSKEDRLANNVNVSIPGLDTEYATIVLDAKGIACSTRSACSGQGGGVSKVVYEMTHDKERAISTLRFTLGENTTKSDIDLMLSVFMSHVIKYKKFSASHH